MFKLLTNKAKKKKEERLEINDLREE